MSENIFDGVLANSFEEIFTSLVKNEKVHIERIVSYGQVTVPGQWLEQSENEWVMLVKGEAKIEFENDRIEILKEGDYINISAHQKHRVSWTKENTETVWLAVHY
jgi:cupin 2 domain-containing protein